MEALRVANDLQVEGAVKDEDKSFAFDSTPAANKVDKTEIEGGDMVNVIQQALEIRLDKSILNGGQTSAALMASDFLLEELESIVKEYPGNERPPSKKEASGGYAKAYGFDAVDYDDDSQESEEAETAEMSAMWGGGGVPMTSDEED